MTRIAIACLALLFAGCFGGSSSEAECVESDTACDDTVECPGDPRCGGGDDGPAPPPPGTPPGTPPGAPPGTPPGSDGNASVPYGPPRNWTQPGSAAIRPGVQMFAAGSQCTSNFVFTSRDNRSVYLGFAAHCVGDGGPLATSGCSGVGTLAINSTVEVAGAQHMARLAYVSWATMQDLRETDSDTCRYNDFAVVELDPSDANRTNPAMLHFGGPSGLAQPKEVQAREKVLTYGDSGTRQGIDALSPHEGYTTGPTTNGGWTTNIVTHIPGVPGDSGSAVILGDGKALGVLVTVGADGNGVTTLSKAMEYAREKGGLDLQLATWDVLNDGLLP